MVPCRVTVECLRPRGQMHVGLDSELSWVAGEAESSLRRMQVYRDCVMKRRTSLARRGPRQGKWAFLGLPGQWRCVFESASFCCAVLRVWFIPRCTPAMARCPIDSHNPSKRLTLDASLEGEALKLSDRKRLRSAMLGLVARIVTWCPWRACPGRKGVWERGTVSCWDVESLDILGE